YPPERNYLSAHVTLFHSLPPSAEAEMRQALSRLTASEPRPSARLTGLRSLGGGTALAIRCPALLALRAQLAEGMHGMLSAQDRHTPNLHITIQNKVSVPAARAL